MTNYLTGIPIIEGQQQPNSANNLQSMISALQQNSFKPQQSQNQTNPFSSFMNSFNKGNSGTDMNAMFGGYNYNNMAPGSGLSGNDLAGAAQAGVASGLNFDPTTGVVS